MLAENEKPIKGLLREATLILLGTLTVMIGSPISPGLSKITDHFDGLIGNAEFLTKFSLTVPAITFALFALIIGFLVDKWGRKPVLISSLILYVVAGSMGFYINNLYAIIVSRAFLGIAAAGNMNTILTLIGDYYQGEKRNRVLGFQVATGAIASVVLALIGGALFDIQWNYPYLVYLIPAILLPTTIFVLHEPKNQEMGDEVDKDDNLLDEKVEDSENNLSVKGLSTKWIIAICYFSIFALMFFFYLGPSQISYHIVDLGLELSSFKVGIIMAAVMVAAALIGALYNQFKKFLNFHIISLLGFGLLGIGFLILSFANSFAIFLVAALVGGFGFGFLLPNFSLYLVNNTTAKNRGKVVSGYNTMWYIGESLSPIVFQPIIVATSYSAAFLIGSIGFFVLLVIPITLLILHYTKKNLALKQPEKI